MKMFKLIGVMSGTSMDGLDLAYCEFVDSGGRWEYTIGPAETIAYNQTWITRLTELPNQPAFVLPKTDMYYGKYIGQCINTFVSKHALTVDFIASHGHTIFHDPAGGYTTQIGNGNAIFAETGIPVIYDFRSLDVMLGGQGAPLVPIGDELLFDEYDACLNLGGFANISFTHGGKRLAFDIGPCNILLNQVARQAGLAYDDKGAMAAGGKVNSDLLTKLNGLPFYAQSGAKSLGREWVEREIWPVVQPFEITVDDLLATFTAHIAEQIRNVFDNIGIRKVLVTGGGAFNDHLIALIAGNETRIVHIPNSNLVNYKEAMVFAFLGLLRRLNRINTLKEVTGSKQDSSGGVMVGF